MRSILLRITEEGVENDDVDELVEGIDVSHSSCIVDLSRVVNEKG